MGTYAARRLLQLVPVLLGVSIMTFFLMRLAPGGPEQAALGIFATPESIQAFRIKFGLDQPLPVQYVVWLGKVLQGDLGVSLFGQVPVTSYVAARIPPTVFLTVFAIVIALPVGVLLGLATAARRGGRLDRVARAVTLFGVSMPTFWTGILFLFFFGANLHLFPTGGYIPPDKDAVGTIRSLFLPALTLAVPVIGVISRVVRTATLESLGQEYVRTARAKGLTERGIMLRHVLRNVSVPTVTVVGVIVAFLLGGSVIAETLFTIPGLGRALVDAVAQRDYLVLQAIVLVTATAAIMVGLIVDLSYAFLDPRIRLG